METKFKYVVLMGGVRNGLYFKKYNGCESAEDCFAFISLMKHTFKDVEWEDIYVVETTRIFMSEDEFKNEVEKQSAINVEDVITDLV